MEVEGQSFRLHQTWQWKAMTMPLAIIFIVFLQKFLEVDEG